MKNTLKLFLALAMIVMLLAGCDEDAAPSLFNPDDTGSAQPVITDISPAGAAYAVINNVTFTGTNFSSTLAENFVYFQNTPGEVLEASETRLVVKPPYLFGEDLEVKIAVHGAPLFSETQLYDILDPAPEAADFGPTDAPWSVTIDADGNIYTSLTTGGAGVGVKKIDEQGTITDYAPKGGETYFSAMKVGPGGEIYAVRQVRAIFQIPAGGGASATWAVLADRTAKLADIDFDANQNMWGVGNNAAIYKIAPDKSSLSYDFEADLKAVRIYNGALYTIGIKDGETKIWRFDIDGNGDLGQPIEFFDFSANYDYEVYALTFSADGDCLIGTDGPASVVIVNADGTHAPLYSGLFADSPTIGFAWSSGQDCYMVRGAVDGGREGGETVQPTILKVNMQQNGAPQHGIQ